MSQAVVVGGGPAGLMAAEVLAEAGIAVTLADRMPSLGRRLLMAGRGGLNLTHAEPLERFLTRYTPPEPRLLAAIRAHGNFMEFVPLLLLMIYMASDFHGFRVTAALSIVLLVARVLHAGGMLGMIPKGRLLGAVGTTLLLLVVSVLLVYAGFGLRQY